MIQSPTFWLTLLGSVIVFWSLPKRFRAGFLAAASFAYLATLDAVTSLTLLGWSAAFYYLAPGPDRMPARRRLLSLLMWGILGYLAYFKYIPPLLATWFSDSTANIAIPLGISYFTFKFIHYALEKSRGNLAPHNAADFLCYLYLFPIFTAGPIERFDHFLANRDAGSLSENLVDGTTRIIHGLIKKFVIGGLVIAPLFNAITDAGVLLVRLERLPVYKVWGFLILTYLFVYMDFSAYSDLAIGGSRLFGIRIMENFNWPVLAPNIGNFWKRWHMSLAAWCQAYVYMPTIGLTRNPYLAVFATFLAIGLWHAGHIVWVCWGLYHALGVVTYLSWARYKRKRKWNRFDNNLLLRVVGTGVTFLFVAVGFAFTATHHHGGLYGTLRILAKLVNVDLPA